MTALLKIMKKKIVILINLFIGIMSYAAWIMMIFRTQNGAALASSGAASLRYFTVLSNLFNGTAALIYAGWIVRQSEITSAKKTWKLTAVASVGLTFVTVMVFLGPLYGYNKMFHGANFWMHLVLPVLSIISFIFLERGCKIPFINTFWAIAPMLLYAVVYLVNIGLNGIGEGAARNDIYGFLSWGNAVGALIFISIMAVIWLIAVILYWCGKCKKL